MGAAACPDDIVAYWKLDEASGTNFADFIDDNDGTGNVNVVPGTGKVNGAQTFDGSATIDVAPSQAFNWGPADSFSIEVWVKTATTPSGNDIIIGRGTAASDMFWWVGVNDSGGEAVFYLREDGGSFRKLIGTTVITDNAWHHVVAVRKADTDEHFLYVDGNLETVTSTESGTIDTGFGSSANLQIGYTDGDFYFTGLIDEVALYDKALPLSEINAHFTSGTDYCGGEAYTQTEVFAPYPDDMAALWPLDESGGTTYTDTFGDNDGTGQRQCCSRYRKSQRGPDIRRFGHD